MIVTWSDLIAAAARPSRRNRSRAFGFAATSGRMTLSAIGRCSVSSSARKTNPIPPSPSNFTTRYPPSRPRSPSAPDGDRNANVAGPRSVELPPSVTVWSDCVVPASCATGSAVGVRGSDMATPNWEKK